MVILNNLNSSEKITAIEEKMKCPSCEKGYFEPFNPNFPYYENHYFTCDVCGETLHCDPVVEIK